MNHSTNERLEWLPLNSGVGILSSHAGGLIALEKPAGLMSHPNKAKETKRALLVAEYDFEEERYEWRDGAGNQRYAWLINRLDSPTSGVILLGLNAEVTAAAKARFAAHAVTKVYYALVRGKPALNTDTWSDRIKKEVYRGAQSGQGEAFVPAQTRMELVQSSAGPNPVSLLKLTPLTGRTHQLRIQCQKRGLPIVGDRTYGDFSFNRQIQAKTGVKRMLLHSAEAYLEYTLQEKTQKFFAESALPESFAQVLGDHVSNHSKPVRSEILKGRRFKA